jgi:hypothetical protein
MANFTRCIAAIRHAAGRELSDDEIIKLLERLQKTANDLKAGRVKPDAQANLASPEGLIQHAAELEAKKMVADVELKARRAVRDAEVAQTRQAEMGAMRAAGLSHVEAVRRLLVNHPDGRADQFSLEQRVMGVEQMMRTKIIDTWAALGNNVFEYFQRADKARALINEVRGIDSGDPMAKKAAAAWLKATEEARVWFNDRGGKIGKLEDWGMPQHHSQDKVARAAGGIDRAANQRAWVDFIMPLLDRQRYSDLAGRPMSDAEMGEFLGNAWESISTGGANKIEPGKPRGTGARSNRHADERQIHIKDADAAMAYWDRFGDKTLPDILLGHVESMAKDIAFVEHFGSNPNAMFRLLRDQAEAAAKLAAPHDSGKVDAALANLDRLYDYAAGNVKPVANRNVAATFKVLHNLNTAGKLGSAFWASAIGDKAMFEAMGRVNNLPAMQLWYNELRLLNPANAAERRMLQRHALMLDHMGTAMNRFGDELGHNGLTDKLAAGVMKVSGMNAINEWRRGAWALTAMDTLGHLVKTRDFAKIGPDDMRMLQTGGVTDADWRVWKLAKLEDIGHGNDTGLTHEAVMRIPDADMTAAGFTGDLPAARRDAAVKLLGLITSESRIAIIEPGWSERAMMYGGLRRGSVRDELTRSFWQFKSFPVTQFERIWQIGMSRQTVAGRAAFLGTMPVMMTLLGAAMIQVQALLSGKDMQPMDNWKFWAAAFLKGGSLGLYGDFLFSQSGTTRMGTGPLEAVAGPTIGAVADLAALIAKAPGQINKGEEPRIAANALNIAKGFVPGQNLWYTKAATDHWIFQNAQETLNPGYLDSMRARSLREQGNDWFWKPGAALPERMPESNLP